MRSLHVSIIVFFYNELSQELKMIDETLGKLQLQYAASWIIVRVPNIKCCQWIFFTRIKTNYGKWLRVDFLHNQENII